MKKAKPKKTTIADVARESGVSKTTVSRFLHDDYSSMSEETKDRIEAVIARLGYRPNRVAQSLKSDRSNSIGLTIADIGNPFSSLLIKGIQAECRRNGSQLLVTDAGNDPDQEAENIESLLDAQVDGLIVNTTGGRGEDLRTLVSRPDSKPMVMVDRIESPIPCDSVSTDNAERTVELIRHAADHGFNAIVFVTEDPAAISTRRARADAVERTLSADPALTGEVLILDRSDDAAVTAAFENLPAVYPDRRLCIIANNDDMLRTCIQILSDLDQSIGTDIGLCAFADEKWACVSGPGITCIDQSPYEMGQKAAQLLFERLDGSRTGPAECFISPARLYPHASTTTTA